MKFISKSFTTLTIILCVCFAANAQIDWVGEYFFGEDGGETAGGTKIYIAHTIKITQDGDKLKAHIYSQGFQTSKDIYADVKTNGDKIMLYFREKGEDDILGNFKKGDLLLTLERKEFDGKSNILTFWEKFQPSLEVNEKSGEIYFKKVEEVSDSIDNSKAENQWTRIETADGNLSVAFPSNFLVDTKKDKKTKRTLRIIGFQEGVEMELSVFEDKKALDRLKMFLRKDDRNYEQFQKGEFQGRRSYLINSNAKISESIQLATKDIYYYITVKTNADPKSVVMRFLQSIKVNKEPLFNVDNEINFPEKNVQADDLKTSLEIVEAYKNKSAKYKKEIIYELVSNTDKIAEIETKDLSRPVIIVERPSPNLSFGPFVGDRPRSGLYEIKFKVEFLSNGQIGNITAYSAKNEPFTKSCLDSIKKIKFIPAQTQGKNVSAEKIIEYTFTLFSSPRE